MHPDLMGTPGFQLQGDKGISVLEGEPSVMRAGRIAMHKINPAFNRRSVDPSDWRSDRSGFFYKTSSNGKVFPVYLSSGNHIGEKRGAVHVFGDDQQPGRIAV